MRTAIMTLILIYGIQITKADDMKVLFLAPPEAKIKTSEQVSTVSGFGEVSISELSLAKKFQASNSLWRQSD